MSDIGITPPKFDLHGFYEARIKYALQGEASNPKQQLALLKALVNQAYQQGRYDARIMTKNNN
jgi:hypothetical protein